MSETLKTIGREFIRRPWWTVAFVAAIAASARFAGAFGHPVPWIFGDEFTFAEMARNFGDRAAFAVRDQPDYLSLVTTLLDAPGFALFADAESAYVWIKATNAIVMAAAAFPAYGLARMVLSVRLALLFTALVLAWPAFAYVHVVMTEPASFPAFLLAVWLLARAVERPSMGRQAAAFGAVALCIGVRLQLVVLLVAVPIVCIAAAFLGGERGPGRLRRLLKFGPTIAVSVGLPLAAIGIWTLRGRPIRSLLGGYQGNDPKRVDIGEMLPWLGHHVAVMGLALLFVPAAIGVSVLLRYMRRGGSPAETGVFSVILVVVPLVVVQVVAYASVYGLRVLERNMFVVEPLLLLCALAGICKFGYSRIVAVAAACGFAWAVFALPVTQLLRPPPFSDTFSLLALMSFADRLDVDPQTLLRVIALAAVAVTVALALTRTRAVVWAMGAVLLPALAWSSYEVTRLLHRYSTNVATVLVPRPFDWVDRAVGADARVALLWPADDTPTWVWEQEIWNRSIRSVVAIDGSLLETKRGSFSRGTGDYVPQTPEDVPPEDLVLAPSRWRLQGEPVAEARALAIGLTLWKINKPLRLTFLTTGVFADGWTGKTSEFFAYGCAGGAFRVSLWKGFGSVQRVTVTASGRPPVDLDLRSPRAKRFRFPATPDPATGTCKLTVDVKDSATGDEVSGNGDPRVLGVHIVAPTFEPRS